MHVTKEPTDGPAGSLVRWGLKHIMTFEPEVMALLFAADRVDHLAREVEPRLADGDHVISDRYYLSEYAYQSVESDKGTDVKWLRQLNSKCRQPDVTVFLDVPVEASLSRMHSDQWRALDRLQLYEDEEMLSRVRKNYLAIIEQLREEGENIEVVSGTGSVEKVHAAVVEAVRSYLESNEPNSTSSRPASSVTPEIEARLGLPSSSGG